MKFEEYYQRTLAKIAAGQPVDRAEFHEVMITYFALVGSGMRPQAARAVMDLYMPDDMPDSPNSVYYEFPDEP